jgi:hypothetical protein
MKSILSRYAIAAIVPALLIAAAPVTAKPVPKAPTIAKAPTLVKAQDAVTQANPKNKAPKKNAKIEALRSAIYDYYADRNYRSEPHGISGGSGGFSFEEVTRLDLQSFKGDQAEVAAIVLDRSYGGGTYGETTWWYKQDGTITRNVVIKLVKQGNRWKVEDTTETSNDWQTQNQSKKR